MSFAWAPTQFSSLELFRRYLAGLVRPSWVEGATIHHTAIPTVKQWRGLDSMDGIGNHYKNTMKWEAGPHLFLCSGAPDKRHDGIFLGTPLDTKGIHAGRCNADRWGLEVVGNYDKAPWPDPVADLVYGVLLLLAEFGQFPPETVNGHRECNSPKTCPGKAIDMDAVRAEAKRRAMPDWQKEWGPLPYFADSGIAQRWRAEHATKPLGEACSDEYRDWLDRVIRVFRNGAIWYWNGTTGVWR